MLDSLNRLFSRDLEKLREEILSYQNEPDLWVVRDGITNCAGNLALHITGNLRYFIGATLGGTDYVRDRHAEFHAQHVPRDEILHQIDAALADVEAALSKLTPESLTQPYPIEVFGHPMSAEFFLIHLHGHLNYHLGQVNYHRRLLAVSN